MDPEKKSLNFIFPTKYVIPKSLKFSHWPSKQSRNQTTHRISTDGLSKQLWPTCQKNKSTYPAWNQQFAPENGCLEYDRFLCGSPAHFQGLCYCLVSWRVNHMAYQIRHKKHPYTRIRHHLSRQPHQCIPPGCAPEHRWKKKKNPGPV